jgi:hypothetical protein
VFECIGKVYNVSSSTSYFKVRFDNSFNRSVSLLPSFTIHLNLETPLTQRNGLWFHKRNLLLSYYIHKHYFHFITYVLDLEILYEWFQVLAVPLLYL